MVAWLLEEVILIYFIDLLQSIIYLFSLLQGIYIPYRFAQNIIDLYIQIVPTT